MDLLNSRFEIKEVTSTGSFSGYGSVFNNVDSYDDIVAPGAFGQSLTELSAKGQMPAMLWQHKSDQPCGAWQTMKEDAHGLQVEGKLALKTQRGAEAYELMQMKALSGLSIGFVTRDDSYDQKTGVRTIKQADLWEVSLVTFPANTEARIAQVKATINEIADLKSAEKFLRDAGGLSRSEAVAFVSQLKSVLQRDAASEDDMKEVLAALNRRHQIIS